MHPIKPDQVRAAAATLAIAFQDDPLLQIIQADEARRSEAANWFFEVFLRYGVTHADVLGNEDVTAVALWLPPGKTDVSMLAMLRAGLWALPLRLGPRGALRFLRGMSETEVLHEAVEGPHWYLGMIGTRPERQGQGLGQQLVAYGTDQADVAGLPCYLETGTEANVAFYRKRGFEVSGETMAGGFPLWGMIRPPQPPNEGG